MRCIAQVEIDPFCQRVLARHWPEVPRWGDIKELHPDELPRADLICAGFPCQPFSSAGRRRGVADDRWMWPAVARIVRVVRPRYVLVENVPALLDDAVAFGWLLADLASLGFDAEWGVLSACALGAPHTRERLFLVAYPNGSHGPTRLGLGALGPRTLPDFDHRARAWRDRVTGALEASRTDDREADGTARRLVEMGGIAVVPQVAEHVGRLILQVHLSRAGARAADPGPPTSSSAPAATVAPGGAEVAPALDAQSEVEVPTGSPQPGPAALDAATSASDPRPSRWRPPFVDNDAREVPTTRETVEVKEGVL